MEGELVTGTYALDLQLLLTFVVAGTWWALYGPLLDRPHYRWWAWGWTVFLVFLVGVRLGFTGLLPPGVARFLSAPAGLLQVACFALGAETLRRDEEVEPRARRLWLAAAAVVGVALAVGQAPLADEITAFTVQTLIRAPGLALALGWCGWLFLDGRESGAGAGIWLVAGGFLLYAFDQTVYTLGALDQGLALARGTSPAAFGIGVVVSDVFMAADMVAEAAIGVGAILLLVRDKNRLYRSSRRSERRFQAVFRGSRDGIVVADREGRIRTANPAALELLGFDDEAELVGLRVRDLQDPDAGQSLPDAGAVRERGGVTVETDLRTRDGGLLPAEVSLSAYRVGDRTRIQAILRDVSARRTLMAELEHRATHRSLTDLPNRQHVRKEIERALAMHRRDGPPPGLLFLDLDDFKAVNDTHGHAFGDRVLAAVADRLRAAVRDTELVGHPGGDEFVVLVQTCEDEEALGRMGDRIARAFDDPFDELEPGIELSVSIGAALAREGDEGDDLLRRADEAMYRVKGRPGEAVGLAAGD